MTINTEELKDNVRRQDTWLRGLNILLFIVIYSVVEIVLLGIVVYQFLSLLFTTTTNRKFEKLSADLSRYVYEILRYITFNMEKRPYPFADFPDGKSLVD